MAFRRVGMPIRWQGPEELGEVGTIAEGRHAVRVVVTVSPQLLRPVEVRSFAAEHSYDHICLSTSTLLHTWSR